MVKQMCILEIYVTDSENDENDITLNGKLFGKCIAFGAFEKEWLFNEVFQREFYPVVQGLKDSSDIFFLI